MQVDVYETDAEALDAAAALVDAALASATAAQPAVAIAGGRGGRGIMLALTSRVDLPWSRARFCVVDEPLDGTSNRTLLHEHLLVPRGIAGPAPAADGDRAAAWEAEIRSAAGPGAVFDVLVLDLGPAGEIGVLDGPALASAATSASVVRTGERIGLGPAALGSARHVVVIATGAQRSRAVADVLRAPDASTSAAKLLLPSERVQWVLDRAAAAELLRDARPAPA
jgi:6-phosphogluconolactonase/glucosamine-6-phosphate isomerase/deaminase